MEFAELLPAWVGKDGYPLSWKHFQYGLSFIRRSRARNELSLHSAFANAQAKHDDANAYRRELRMLAGL